MKTYSVNSLAENFEVDRATLVRALKNTAPDAEVTKGRPTYKTSTAARALEAHRQKAGNTGSSGDGYKPIDPRLASLYAMFDQADSAMRKLPTLIKRRTAALNLIRPIIMETQRMQMIVGKENGQDPEITGLFCDKMYMLALRGLEGPCDWSQDETWDAINK